MMALSRPVRRLAALGLLALPPLLAWPLLAAPWIAAREDLAARQERAVAIEARALALASRRPALEAEVAALGRALTGGAEGVPGASHALAGAELQRRLRDAARRHGGAVQSLETLPPAQAEAAEGMVGLRARLQLDPAGLRGLLAELETGRALLQVQAMGLTNASGRGAQQALEVQLELLGLRAAGQAP